MERKVFNANKKMIIQELETFLIRLKTDCDSAFQLKYLANNYLTQAIEDIKRVVKEAGANE